MELVREEQDHTLPEWQLSSTLSTGLFAVATFLQLKGKRRIQSPLLRLRDQGSSISFVSLSSPGSRTFVLHRRDPARYEEMTNLHPRSEQKSRKEAWVE